MDALGLLGAGLSICLSWLRRMAAKHRARPGLRGALLTVI